jgi:hypothetical protein
MLLMTRSDRRMNAAGKKDSAGSANADHRAHLAITEFRSTEEMSILA